MAQSSIRQRCGQVEGCQLPPGAVPGPGHGAAEHRARQPAAQRVILVAAASLAIFFTNSKISHEVRPISKMISWPPM